MRGDRIEVLRCAGEAGATTRGQALGIAAGPKRTAPAAAIGCKRELRQLSLRAPTMSVIDREKSSRMVMRISLMCFALSGMVYAAGKQKDFHVNSGKVQGGWEGSQLVNQHGRNMELRRRPHNAVPQAEASQAWAAAPAVTKAARASVAWQASVGEAERGGAASGSSQLRMRVCRPAPTWQHPAAHAQAIGQSKLIVQAVVGGAAKGPR